MQLTIVLPDEIGERVQRLPDPSRFIAEILAKALGQRATPHVDDPPESDRRRWLHGMRRALKIEGEPESIEAIQAMSRECALDENELSRSVIEARER